MSILVKGKYEAEAEGLLAVIKGNRMFSKRRNYKSQEFTLRAIYTQQNP